MKKFLYLIDNYSFGGLIKAAIKYLYTKWFRWLNKHFDKNLVNDMDEINKMSFYIWKYIGPLLIFMVISNIIYWEFFY